MPSILSLLCLGFIIFIIDKYLSSNKCKLMETCSDCIRTPNCVWCAAKPGDFTTDSTSVSRCEEKQDDDALKEVCDAHNIFAPENYVQILKNVPFTEANRERVFQMKPQHVKMVLRNQEPQKININFRETEDFPVDLYYLMSLSRSMADKKKILSTLGYGLAEKMQSITRNFSLGFGTFVDKTDMSEKLITPCVGCVPPYGFRNVLRLTSDADAFVREVNGARVSRKVNAPKGGSGAIMQAIKCNHHIGWRNSARRLLLVATDLELDDVRDGRSGEIAYPDVGKCHLDKKGYYSHSDDLDYPSLSQIGQAAKEENIDIIFAVTSEHSEAYADLPLFIEGSTVVELASDSSNIVKLVRKKYQNITSRVELRDNAKPPVFIKYFSSCKEKTEAELETSVCDNVGAGDEAQFTMEVYVDKCPLSVSRQQIEIYPIGLPNTLILELEVICRCELEKQELEKQELEKQELEKHELKPYLSVSDVDDSACRADESSEVCSGRGTCMMNNYCLCHNRMNVNEMINGVYCECTNFLCDHHNEQLCSGPDHGTCECNQCSCKPEWVGDACDCENSVSSCVNPETGRICSNNGICECNQCRCYNTEGGRYTGKYCENCPTCGNTCMTFKPCVQCVIFGTGELNDEECEKQCAHIPFYRVLVVEANV